MLSTLHSLFKLLSLTELHKVPFSRGEIEGFKMEGHFYCPYADNNNPLTDQVRPLHSKWLLDMGLAKEGAELKKMESYNFPLLCGKAYLKESALPQLEVETYFVTWLFVHDHFRDKKDSPVGKDPEKVQEMNRLFQLILSTPSSNLETPEIRDAQIYKEDPIIISLVRSLIDIRDRLLQFTKSSLDDVEGSQTRPGKIQHFVKGMDKYFKANLWEAQHRQAREKAELAGTTAVKMLASQYMKQRRYTSALLPCYEIAMVVRQKEIPGTMRDDVNFILASDAGSDNVCYVNDVGSLLNELDDGVEENLVGVYHFGENKPWDKALEKTVQDSDACIADYETARGFLHGKHSESVNEYLDIIRDWIPANLFWTFFGTDKYKGEL